MFTQSLIMFHGNSSVYGRPNSAEAVKQALTYYADIIELDIRKSKDNILYCYHGGMLGRLLKYFKFVYLKKKLKVDKLEQVLEFIPQGKIVFFDIKDRRITADDLKTVCDIFNLKYWIAGYKLWYLGQLKSILKNYTFVYNFGFVNLKKGVEEAKRQGVDIIKVFRWQLRPNLKSVLLQSGIKFTIHPWFTNPKTYLQYVEKYGSVWVAYDDLNNLEKPLIQI